MRTRILSIAAVGLVAFTNVTNADDSITLSSPEFNPIATIHAKVPPRASVLAEVKDTAASATEVVVDTTKKVADKAKEATETATKVTKEVATDTAKSAEATAKKAAEEKPLRDPKGVEPVAEEEVHSSGDMPTRQHEERPATVEYYCDSPTCDMVGGCDQPGGCGGRFLRAKKPLIDFSKFKNPFKKLRTPVSGCGSYICDEVGGCDMPGGCGRIFDGRVRDRIRDMDIGGPNGPVKRLARKMSCGSRACDEVGGCDMPGGCGRVFDGHVFDGRVRDRIRDMDIGGPNGPVKRLVRKATCGSPSCDDAGGCDMPGGCGKIFDGRVRERIREMDIGGPNGPVKRLARRATCSSPTCDEECGCDLPGTNGKIFDGRVRDRIREMDIGGPNGPVKRISRKLRCGSPICDAAGGCDLPGGCGRVFDGEMMQRMSSLGIRDRLFGGSGPIRNMMRSRSCDLPGCDIVGSCDSPDECDMLCDGPCSYATPKNYRFLVNPCRNAQNPGALFRWRCQQYIDLPRLSDAMVTDRPDFTEASSVVGLRVTQVELGYTYIYDGNGPGSTKTNSYPEILVRRGIFRDWLELRLAWNYFNEEASGVETDGSDDISLGFKLGLTSQFGWLPELALITQMSVPTGSDGFNSREVQPGMNLIYGWALNDALSLAGSTQFNRSSDDTTDESYYEWAQSCALSYSLTDNVGLYGEYFGLYPTSADTVKPQNFLNGGLTYLINNDVQWDIRYGTGLDSNTPDYFAGTGLSIRFR